MQQQELFKKLIKVSLGTMKPNMLKFSKEEWRLLYEAARRQGLLGICFAGVCNIRQYHSENGIESIPSSLYIQWLGMAGNIMHVNERMSKQCVEIQKFFKESGFQNYILKGQGIETFYEMSLRRLRQPGDIDIWVIGDMKSILSAIKRKHLLRHCDYMHTHFDYFKDTVVEVHYRPWISRNLIRNYKLQKLARKFADVDDGMVVDGDIIIPNQKFTVIHVINHIYWHLLVEGVGLRQMMDLYFVLKSINEHNGIMKTLQWLGLGKFTRAAMWVLGEVFGMGREDMLCEPSEKEGRFLLEEIEKAGNFGHYDTRLNHQTANRFELYVEWVRHSLRLIRHYPGDVLWNPIGIVWLSMKGRMIRKKYV